MKSPGSPLMMIALASATVLAAFNAISATHCLIMSCDVDDASQRAGAIMGSCVQALLLFGFWVLFVPCCMFFSFLLRRVLRAAQSLFVGAILALLLLSYGVSELLFVPGIDDFEIVLFMATVAIVAAYGGGVIILVLWGGDVLFLQTKK